MLKEDDLRARLHALADPVQSAADPVAAVHDRVRVRRQRRSVALVALSVVILTVGVAVWYGPSAQHHRRPTPGGSTVPASAPPAKAPDLGHLRSAQQVWPHGVRLLPSRLPDGRDYAVAGVVGDGRYLINVYVGFDLFGDVAILDTGHGNTLTVLSAETAGHGDTQYQPQRSTLTADGVAWAAVAQRDGQWTTEVWAANLTARSARLVATLPGRAVASRGAWVVGGQVLFAGMTGGKPGPMYSVPASGQGQPREIPASRGRWPVTAGWISSVNPFAPFAEGSADQYNESLFNVLTGARVPIRPNPSFETPTSDGKVLTALSCGPTWCLGWGTGTDGSPRIGVQHPDGTGFAAAGPAFPATVFGGGRFVVGYLDVGNDRVQDFIWDVVSGTAATFGSPVRIKDHVSHSVGDPGQNCYTWLAPNGKVILDSTAFR